MAIRIKTSLSNFTMRYKELEELSQEWDCSVADAARECVFSFCAAAGFCEDQLEEEFASFDDDQIIEYWCNLS